MRGPTYTMDDARVYHPMPARPGGPEPRNLDELPAWADYMEVRKIGDLWQARLVGTGQPEYWMRLNGMTARVSVEGTGGSPGEAIADALEHEPR